MNLLFLSPAPGIEPGSTGVRLQHFTHRPRHPTVGDLTAMAAGSNILQIFNAIAKSNGWMDKTAALQLCVHLEGGGLNVALLMSEGECANREGLSRGLSNYYNSPGRLAVFRRKLKSVTHHVRHGTRDFGGPGIWGYGYSRPEPDGPGQIYCGTT